MSLSLKRLFDKLGQGASSAEFLHEWVSALYRNRADLAGTNLFSDASSENLQRLYALLDSPVRSVRQSAMVIFALVFLSPLAKAMFLLKFGLSVKPGKIMISRLKVFKSEVDAVELLATPRQMRAAVPLTALSARTVMQGRAAIDGQAAFAFVGVGADDLDVAPLGVFLNLVGLVVRGVLLMLGGHAHVLGGAEGGW